MNYTAEQLRQEAASLGINNAGLSTGSGLFTHRIAQLRAHADLIEQSAKRDAEFAKLKAHAEAMHREAEDYISYGWDHSDESANLQSALDDYRSDFPKEPK